MRRMAWFLGLVGVAGFGQTVAGNPAAGAFERRMNGIKVLDAQKFWSEPRNWQAPKQWLLPGTSAAVPVCSVPLIEVPIVATDKMPVLRLQETPREVFFALPAPPCKS